MGCEIGDFGVREWFWKRVPSCPSKLAFVSVMGMGLEAANLEYAGETRGNHAIVPVGSDGAISLFTQSGTHLVVDAFGWFT